MRRFFAVIALVVLVLTPVVSAQETQCVAAPYEYCQTGCDELASWTVEDHPSMEMAANAWTQLDPQRQISAFIVQPPSGFAGALLLRRETQSEAKARKVTTGPHWEVQGYNNVLEAAADAYVKGGWVYATNENSGPTYMRVWYESCWVHSGKPEAGGNKQR